VKEYLRRLWSQREKQAAYEFLIDWIWRAGTTGIDMLFRFPQTIETHMHGILAYYDYPISTCPLEGINNKIKTMKMQAYGFRDLEFFKLKIWAFTRPGTL
jgi:transposase